MMAFDLNMDKHKKVHFIGIGGVSMSGLAAVLLTKGYKVSGSAFDLMHYTQFAALSGFRSLQQQPY